MVSVFLAVGVLAVGALGRFSTVALVWVAAPLVLLGLAEAGYAARQGQCAELLKTGKRDEPMVLLPAESGLNAVRRMVLAVLSLSIWPFYLALWGVVAAGAVNLPKHATPSSVPSIAEVGPVIRGPGQSNLPGAYNSGPGYPPGTAQRFPNVGPYNGPVPGNPGLPPRTPGPGFPRPVTPVNFGPKLLNRPAGPPATVNSAPPAGVPAPPPVRSNP